jgi:hypothetical protein
MTKKTSAAVAGPAGGLVAWLAWGAFGPAAVAIPATWAAEKLADAAVRWFQRLRKTDDLSRMVDTATDSAINLSNAEFKDLRKLLEKQETWRLLAGHQVSELSGQIADRLPARDGRTAEDSTKAAWAIAHGLLEFAVFELDPENFQKVALARLEHLTSRASSLESALYDLHSDLYAHAEGTTDLLRRVMDRLPPGPAGQTEIVVYLRTLIFWLNSDQWPEDRRLLGPALTPAAIERKLRITATNKAGQSDLDADGLAQQCQRLVILGGPGSGKTWLARRAARRCAEDALDALAAGGTLDDVELPLYTTCARLFSAAADADRDIREAAVSSALSQIGDLGGSRLTKALRLFFTDRNEPAVLVIDSLDEARGSDAPLRLAGTLPWRIILTSRPSSWDNQLRIEKDNDSHRVGELQPLRYPDDVEPFIECWFGRQSKPGQHLAEQIAQHPYLQRAATVPLILAFYCIIGGDKPLPDRRNDVYPLVIRRMLTGRWHGGRVGNSQKPDLKACLRQLRAWAWSGASNHPVSGIGTWADDIPTDPVRLNDADAEALDHVATPVDAGDLDTEEILRRFVHRSIREHLVAEEVASLSVDEAVKVLLPHLWYDPDWAYTAPAAIAIHRQRDELLRVLLRHVSRTGEIHGDPSADDAGNEIREVLALIAAESEETDWSTETATVIGQARVELARSGVFIEAAGWPASNSQIRQIAITRMAADVDSQETARWASRLAELDLAPGDKHLASETVLGQLRTETYGWRVRNLADTLARLEPASADKRRARDVLLARLGDNPSAPDLAAALLLLEPSPDDKRRALATMLAQLADPAYPLTDWYGAPYLMFVSMPDVLVRLEPTAEDTRQARDALLERLGRERNGERAVRLMDMLIRLDPAPQARHQVLDAGLQLLLVFGDEGLAFSAGPLPEAVMGLAQSDEEKHRALDMLLRYLSGQVTMTPAADLAPLAAQLDPTSEDKRRARQVLLGLLKAPIGKVLWETKSARDLIAAFLRLDPEPDEVRQACPVILGLLRQAALEGKRKRPASDRVGPFAGFSGQNYSAVAADLAAALLQLDPPAEAKRQARYDLLGLLTNQDRSGETADQADLAVMLGKLDPESSDKGQACGALLALLARNTRGMDVKKLTEALAQLDPTPSVKDQARRILQDLLRGQAVHSADKIMAGLTLLDATPDHLRQTREAARDALLAHIGTGDFPTFGTVAKDVNVLVQLASTPEDKRKTLDGLLGLLARETNSDVARDLIRGIAQFDPTVRDLSSWPTWAASPSRELLAAARRNSALHEWLTIFSL